MLKKSTSKGCLKDTSKYNNQMENVWNLSITTINKLKQILNTEW